MGKVLKTMILCAALAAVGCSSTPVPEDFAEAFANHFENARADRDHGKCMAENAMFNNRQLMVAPMAVENAWAYCAKKSDVWYPGSGSDRTAAATWR
jgi:hypothetical protein